MAEVATRKTFQFELVSPEKVLISEQAKIVRMPGMDGQFAVLAGHADMLAGLKPGLVKVTLADDTEHEIFISAGFADINPEMCSLLAEDAVPAANLDKSALESELATLKAKVQEGAADVDNYHATLRQIEFVQTKLRYLNAA